MEDREKKLNWNGKAHWDWCNWEAVQCALEAGPRLDDIGCTAGDRLVLIALARRANDKLECWPGKGALAGEAGVGASTVTRAVDRLESAGVIVVTPRDDDSNHYRILPEIDGHSWVVPGVKMNPVQNDPCQNEPRGVSEWNHPPVSKRHDPPCQNDTLIITSKEEQFKEEQERTTTVSAASLLSTQEVKQVRKPAKPKTVLNGTGKYANGFQSSPGATSPTPPNPGQEAANHLFEMLGEPSSYKQAVKTSWPGTLSPLVQRHSLDLVKALITWAIMESNYWLEWLEKARDPAAKTVEKFDQWLTQRANATERAARRPHGGVSAPTPKPQASWDEPPILGLKIY